jgi:hypothetical protein
MPRFNIGDLSLPDATYRIGKNASFERKVDCRAEDTMRAKLLRKAIDKFPNQIDVAHARRLAWKLERSGETGENQHSPASSLHMGHRRYRICGALWKLADATPAEEEPAKFTVIPTTWEFAPGNLSEADPVAMMAAFRTDLYGAGASAECGWLIAFIHGEFDPAGNVFRLHIHGLASRSLVPVLDKLRKRPRYKSVKALPDGKLCPVNTRVWITRKPLTNLPAPLTYLVKSYWPSRPIFFTDEGKRIRARQQQRITEPYHSQALLWMDRWKVADLSLMIGLRATRTGLIRSTGR